ncbi:MAG: hypothetical protein FJ104_04500 [Deltaproteobacteria bacterium]|nr:hypothetical protein [Deltaproteobacteria bacterium]
MPPFSVRLDPFNWLLEGRLGFELEAGLLDWMSVEVVPTFIVDSTPATLNFTGGTDPLRQASDGLGPMSGSSIGLGFWPGGKALRGTVLRFIYQVNAMEYRTVDEGRTVDRLTHTEQALLGMIGSHSRIGAFTIAGGFGLGVDMNEEERCYGRSDGIAGEPTGRGCGELHLALDRDVKSVYDVGGFAYPVLIAGRISLGATFD